MPESTFRVIDHLAPRRAVDPNIHEIAQRIADDASSNAPRLTGRLAESYHVVRGKAPAIYLVDTDVEYARYVEFGTRFMKARAPMGRALARARHG